MIVDMERNDLSRVCKPGSVKILREKFVEEYKHLFHYVTSIQGTLKKNITIKEIIKSMVSIADLTRSGFVNGDISTVMSPRTVLTWADNYLLFDDIEYAFKLSFLNRCDELEKPIIYEYFQRGFGIELKEAKVINVKEW